MVAQFHSKQWSYLMRTFNADIPLGVFTYLDTNFELYKKNYEVRSELFVRAIQNGHFEFFAEMIEGYLGEIGRLKYVRPIYLALKEKGLLDFAQRTFEKYKPRNNQITNEAIEGRLYK